MFRLSSVNVQNVQNMFRIFSQCSEYSVMFRLCSECSESVQNFQSMFRIFSIVQTVFRISITKTGLFRISWFCSVGDILLKVVYELLGHGTTFKTCQVFWPPSFSEAYQTEYASAWYHYFENGVSQLFSAKTHNSPPNKTGYECVPLFWKYYTSDHKLTTVHFFTVLYPVLK